MSALEDRIKEAETAAVALVSATALAYAREDLQVALPTDPKGLEEHHKLDALMGKLRALYLARLSVAAATDTAAT